MKHIVTVLPRCALAGRIIRRCQQATPIAVALLLAACSGTAVRPTASAPAGQVVPSAAPVATVPPANVEVKLVVERALAQIGKPYRLGGAGPRGGFDCSGLVAWVYSTLGVRVPRTTDGQFAYFTPVPREQLQPGDLVFFRLPQAHVGIYVGEGEFVHAPATGRPVERARLDGPWFILSFAGGGRLTDSH